MIKENFYQNENNFKKTSGFAENRKLPGGGNYFHSGEDFISRVFKQSNIFNLINGVVEECGFHRDYGNYIIIKHNPKFIGGINNYFYSIYCHLDHDEIHPKRGYFIKAGDVIGKMGNTGNCWTKSITGWRPVTKQEKLNKNCNKGVHLHQGFYQVCDPNKKTLLLSKLMNLNIILDNSDFYYFWQWGKLYFNPKCIMDYFKILQEKKKHGNN